MISNSKELNDRMEQIRSVQDADEQEQKMLELFAELEQDGATISVDKNGVWTLVRTRIN